MVSDPIADMFTRIRNAQAVQHAVVVIPASKQKENIANVLHQCGYIGEVTRKAGQTGDILEIALNYNEKKPAISHLTRISKPGTRRYAHVTTVPRPLSGHGLVILSTSQGIMSGQDAQKRGLGGEVIGTVW
jgi:small subunit ribosomal protein S8